MTCEEDTNHHNERRTRENEWMEKTDPREGRKNKYRGMEEQKDGDSDGRTRRMNMVILMERIFQFGKNRQEQLVTERETGTASNRERETGTASNRERETGTVSNRERDSK